MHRTLINPGASAALYDRYHFSQATRVGDTVWVSGQVGLGADGRPGADMAAQARLAFESLRDVLAASGAALGDVVALDTFHTRLRADMRAFAAAKDEFFPENYPSWTAVGAAELAIPELLVEIRAVAVVGSAKTG
jgi:enamine deaminase RidA (YjgF/YER057c/UK114 family)